MEAPQFMYETYIATTPEKLWEALTLPEFTQEYWSDARIESNWKPGAPVRHVRGDVTLNSGEVLEYDPPRRLAYSWTVRHLPEYEAEGASRVTFEIEPLGPQVRLRVTHEGFQPGSKTLTLIGGGWPIVLSSLKTFLETGAPLGIGRREGKIYTS